MKTKAEHALAEAFEALSPLLPGGDAVAEARAAAIAQVFGARPAASAHRGVEVHRPPRSPQRRAAAGRGGQDANSAPATCSWPWARSRGWNCQRVVFVNGAFRKELSSFEGCGADVSALGETAAHRRRQGRPRDFCATGAATCRRRARAQHRLGDRRRGGARRAPAPAWKSRCSSCAFRLAPSRSHRDPQRRQHRRRRAKRPSSKPSWRCPAPTPKARRTPRPRSSSARARTSRT